MNTRVWTPITEADDAEFFRPADTEEPTTWEVAVPLFGKRQAQVLTAVWGLALGCPQHRFWALASQLKTLPEEGWPANVTLAVGPLRTQAEADEAIPALLAVKAARREVVFAPTEKIDLATWLGDRFCMNCERGVFSGEMADPPADTSSWVDPECPGACPACGGETDSRYPDEIAEWNAVRVRGGVPEHVASLREQCKAAGVEFIEESV
jgi:hypothetical protein